VSAGAVGSSVTKVSTESTAHLLPSLEWGDVLAVDCLESDLAEIRELGRFIASFSLEYRASAIVKGGREARRPRFHGIPLPYPDNGFAAAWVRVTGTVSEPCSPLSEAMRVVRRSGTIVVIGSHAGALETATEMLVADQWKPIAALGDWQVFSTAQDVGDRPASEDSCVFCPDLRFRMNHIAGLPGAGSVLWTDRLLFTALDLAPVARGHLLVVTAEHHLSFAEAGAAYDDALTRAKDHVTSLFERVYRSPAIFLEHGPARSDGGGNCVDHAHLHCVPLRCAGDIATQLESKISSVHVLDRPPSAPHPYLYVETNDKRTFYFDTTGISQLFRQAILSPRPYRWQQIFATADSMRLFSLTLSDLIEVL
jgi:diadenosine tetraphosphate (Ap4A) HIT family hydrolase